MSFDPTRRTLLAASAAVSATPFTAGAQTTSLPLVDPSLKQRVQKAGVPALGFAVVGPEGVRALEASGVRRAGGADPVTPGDSWHIGSNTKAMTAVLYARLVEAGRASWGARLPRLFPDLKLDRAWSEVRIEDLLGHRSGISDRPLQTPERLRAFRQDPRPLAQQRTALAAEVFGKPPVGQPDAFDYSNVGYIIAGAAIERIVRTGWEAAITAQLFQPLKMSNAGFGAPTGAAPWGHELGAGGRLIGVDPAGVADNPPIFGPAGTVHLSLPDYAKFARLFLTDGGGLLRPDSLRRLATPQGGATDGYAMGWQTYGNRPWANGPVLTHEGSNTLWHASALIAPAKGIAILVCGNADAGGGAQAVQALSLALVTLYSGQAATQPKRRRRLWPF